MKKSLRKLNLSRETLRSLESPALGKIDGGAFVALSNGLNACPATGDSCCCTMSCDCEFRVSDIC